MTKKEVAQLSIEVASELSDKVTLGNYTKFLVSLNEVLNKHLLKGEHED
jgi:hypothetical protein